MAPFDLCMSVCISEPWATYSKQLIGHKFCVLCGGNLFVGDGVYPPRGGGGASLGNGSPRGGGEPSSLGGGWTWGGGEGTQLNGHCSFSCCEVSPRKAHNAQGRGIVAVPWASPLPGAFQSPILRPPPQTSSQPLILPLLSAKPPQPPPPGATKTFVHLKNDKMTTP